MSTTTMVTNRIASHGPALSTHKCKYKRCKRTFASPQGLAMHIGRVHTGAIPNATGKAVSLGLKKAREQAAQAANGKHKSKRTTEQAVMESKPKRKYKKRQPAIAPLVAASAQECVVNGPGLRIEFSPALLPTILHTIALAIGGKKGR